MNFYSRARKIFKSFKNIYFIIGVVKRDITHHFFILWFEILIEPRLDSFICNKNVLFFVLPKHYGNKSKDSAVGIYQIIDPLQEFLKASNNKMMIHLWFPDENTKVYNILDFLKKIHTLGPKKIIIDSPQYNSTKFKDFGTKIYYYIQKKYKIEMIEIGWDTISKKWWKEINSNDLDRTILILDNPRKTFVPKSLCDINKALVVVPPFSLRRVSPVGIHREIDYNFIGSVGSYRNYRVPYLEFVSNLGHKSLLNGYNSRKYQLSREEFLKILNESKISINFSETHSQNFQLKGRVWEVLLAGSMLLEQDNDQIKHYFTDGIHFISFSNKFELKEHLLYFVNNDFERIKIAEAGQKRAIELISSSDFFRFITN